MKLELSCPINVLFDLFEAKKKEVPGGACTVARRSSR